jgi:uncharacterized protein YbgA (DUF1722 family)
MERVKLYDRNGVPHQRGVGLFARTFMEHFSLLPVEEEGRLHDARLRENFIECIFTFQRWRNLLAGGRSAARLVDFHARHKLLLLSHSPESYRELGRLVAAAGQSPADELFGRYQEVLLRAMRQKATVAKNCNVLQHLLGYFKTVLSSDEKQELLGVIEHYRLGYFPQVVPITLVNHFVRKYRQPYLQQQFYLHPHPLELQLRNHV